MANGKQIWVSDIIGEDFKRWSKEFVVFDCGTGCGKTYFCLNVLGKYAQKLRRKILYLCNRRKLRKQVYENIRKLGLQDTVYVTSYQKLQNDILKGARFPVYDYIVADECHYFTTDALFNDYTDVSYKFIMQQKESVVIWVSATAKIFFDWLEKKNKVKKRNIYKIEKDYSYVKKVYFYQKDELIAIIDDILENESDSKIIVFCNAANRMEEMNKVYGDKADYYCSNSSSSMKLKMICGYDSVTQKVKECIIDETFSKRLLFTTTVLDNGVDLKDEKIKHVFCEIFDVDCAIQALGRKRCLNKNDTCTFYIREFQDKAIQGFLNINNAQLEPVRMYKKDYKAFYAEYGNGKKRNRLKKNKIFYSFFSEDKYLSKVRVNECKYMKYERDNDILSLMKETGHIPILQIFLEQELASKSEYIVVNPKQIDLFLEYLHSIEGKMLFQEDKKRLKEEFESIGVKIRYMGINTFNGALEDTYKDMYQCRFYSTDINGKDLVEKRRILDDGGRNPNRDKHYWILEKRE